MKRIFFWGVVGVVMLFSDVLFAANSGFKKITREDVLQSLKEHKEEWDRAMRTHSPRLYASGAEWLQIRKEVADMTGTRATWRDAFYDKMDQLIRKPLPVYLTPEERVKQKLWDGGTLTRAKEQLWQRDVAADIFSLALAARLRDVPKYNTYLHDLVERALEFDNWGDQDSPKAKNSDLAAGQISLAIAICYDWHPDVFSEDEKAQICTVIAERVPNLLKGLYGDAYWADAYQVNHNHVSVCGLAFCGVAFYDVIPEAPEWLAAARLNFQNVMKHSATDGSSPEGVPYWTYSRSFILQYIEGTRLVIDSEDLYQGSFLKNAIAFRQCAATPGLEGILPWGDAVGHDYNGPQHILSLLASVYHDEDGIWLAEHLPFPPQGKADSLALSTLWARNVPEATQAPSNLDWYLRDADIVTTRNGWSNDDYMLSIKSGFNNRTHSHLDAGAIALAVGGEWLLTAPGYGVGAHGKDFWDYGGKRWGYYSNSTESHNVIIINGKNQSFDRETARGTITEYLSSPRWQWTDVDLTKAYLDVSAVHRKVLHRRGDYILVWDSILAPEPVKVEWLAQMNTPPQKHDDGLLVTGTQGRLYMKMLEPAQAFVNREPTSPHVDIPKERINTQAVAVTGTRVEFAAFLQPQTVESHNGELHPHLTKGADDRNHIEIDADGWFDVIEQSPAPAAMVLRFGAGHVTGSLTAARYKKGGGLQSLFANDATGLIVASVFEIKTDVPALVSAEQVDGSWIIDSNKDFDGCITPHSGFFLTKENTPWAGGYRYCVAKSKASTSSIQKDLSSLTDTQMSPDGFAQTLQAFGHVSSSE